MTPGVAPVRAGEWCSGVVVNQLHGDVRKVHDPERAGAQSAGDARSRAGAPDVRDEAAALVSSFFFNSHWRCASELIAQGA